MSTSAVDRYVREVKLRRDKVTAFDQYPFSLPVVRHLEALELHPAVTFLVGENGSGKSTPVPVTTMPPPTSIRVDRDAPKTERIAERNGISIGIRVSRIGATI